MALTLHRDRGIAPPLSLVKIRLEKAKFHAPNFMKLETYIIFWTLNTIKSSISAKNYFWAKKGRFLVLYRKLREMYEVAGSI